MTTKSLLCNARIYTMQNDLIVNSMAIEQGRIVAIGDNLQNIEQFRRWRQVNVKGHTVIPGFVDAHTHFYFFALSLATVRLHGLNSFQSCLDKIKQHAKSLKQNEWVLGEGYELHRFKPKVEPDRYMLDNVTGKRPAIIFSKDQHSAWANSKALELAGITKRTREPEGGAIVRFPDGTPTGILREIPAYEPVFAKIPPPSSTTVNRLYAKALRIAYEKGVTGVHSMDNPDAFTFFMKRAEQGNVGLRINYYAPVDLLPLLSKTKTRYGTGTDFFRLAGIKIFADGALGSQTALCFHKYIGSKNNYGIEVTSVNKIIKYIRTAGKLGLPVAVHAIGDKAVANVLDAFEQTSPLHPPARHRIEHLQLVRRKDIQRIKRLGIVASMQPSHCPSDIDMVREYWGARGVNAYIFRTLLTNGIDLAFGSDCPIEPLDPIAGIAAAVRRAKPHSRDVFYPEQRLHAFEALSAFTVGSAIASGESHCRGYLLPGYPADFVVLSDDITKTAPTKIEDIKVLGTVLDGKVKYRDKAIAL